MRLGPSLPATGRERACAFLGFFLGLAPVFWGTVHGVPVRYMIPRSEIALGAGASYTVALPAWSGVPPLTVESDDVSQPVASSVRLYENEQPLGPAHSLHALIRDEGFGQFSHWGSALHFSASDNSDPRTNGRDYSLHTTARLPFGVAWLWALLFVGSSLGRSRRPSSEPWRAWQPAWLVAATTIVAAAALTTLDSSWVGRVSSAGLLTPLWAAALATAAVTTVQSSYPMAREIVTIARTLASRGLAAVDVAEPVWGPAARWLTRIASALERPEPRWRLMRWLTLLVPAAAFTAVLTVALPTSVLTSAYDSLFPVGLVALLTLWACHRRQAWFSTVAGLTATLVLFALPLAALWQDVAFHIHAVGGLLPFSDASGYYYDARRLLDGHPLGWSARRPLFVGLLSTLLAITAQNLQVTLAVLVGLNGVASFLLAREVRVSHGSLAAAATTVMLYLFYRVVGGLGTTLTENIGLALALCGYAAMLRGARRRDLPSLCIGLGLVAFGLISRAGAFFVLPFSVWAIASICGSTWRRWIGAGAAASGAVLAAAVLALGVGRLLADPAGEQTAFSNFSYSLYGLVVGGKGWGQVLLDHPGAAEGAAIYALAYQAFLEHPLGIVEGSVRMWRLYFTPGGPFNAFAFVVDPVVGWHAQIVCYALSVLAIAGLVVRRTQPESVLLLASVLGHVASIPFVPPVDAGLRVYAATMPLLALLIGVAPRLAVVMTGTAPGDAGASSNDDTPSGMTWRGSRVADALGIAIALAATVAPLILLHTRRQPPVPHLACRADTEPVVVRVSDGAFLRIGDGRRPVSGRTAAVEIPAAMLAMTAGQIELRNDIENFKAGTTMVNGYDLGSGRFVWLVVPTPLLAGGSGVYGLCGRASDDPLSRKYGVFFAEEGWQLGSGD